MAKYIDNNGFAHFLGKLKTLLDGKANTGDIPSKTSDLTNDSGYITSAALPTKVSDLTNDAGYLTSVPDLPASKITSGTFDAARLPAASVSAQGAMSAAHYTKLEALPDNSTLSSTYALKSEITSMYKHKGSVSTAANLPSTGQTAGDVYNVTATGMNYVWTGSDWDALGQIFTIDAMTTTEIDTAFTTAGLTTAA